MITNSNHQYDSNWFPYTFIELYKWFGIPETLVYTYREPEDGKFDKSCAGRWKVKYKDIDENKSCESQNLKPMKL